MTTAQKSKFTSSRGYKRGGFEYCPKSLLNHGFYMAEDKMIQQILYCMATRLPTWVKRPNIYTPFPPFAYYWWVHISLQASNWWAIWMAQFVGRIQEPASLLSWEFKIAHLLIGLVSTPLLIGLASCTMVQQINSYKQNNLHPKESDLLTQSHSGPKQGG